MPAEINIALCANGTILPGLHATLGSLVVNLTQRDRVTLTIFAEDINDRDLEEIRETIHKAGEVGTLQLKAVSTSIFEGLRSLQGDRMTYMRLHLPDLLPNADQILYLDSDLIVNTDVTRILEIELGHCPLGVGCVSTMNWSLDHDFLSEIGLKQTDKVFNAGVLLFNAQLWRGQNLTERCLKFGREYSSRLISHDQTILNALFYDNFYELPEKYNVDIYAEDEPMTLSDSIIHFIGSPKPWDPGGRLLHRNWRLWHDAVIKTHFRPFRFACHYFKPLMSRLWSLRRAYLRLLIKRFLSR